MSPSGYWLFIAVTLVSVALGLNDTETLDAIPRSGKFARYTFWHFRNQMPTRDHLK